MKTKIKFLAMMLMGVMLSTNVWGGEQSFSSTDFSRTNKTCTKDVITVALDEVTISSPQIRWSSGKKCVVSSSAGNISQIEVITNSTNTYIDPMGGTVSSGTWTEDTNTKYYWRGDASSVTLTASGAVRITTIKVTYSDAPAYTITAQSNNNTYGTVSLSGKKITASPNTGYTYASPAYTVTSGTATVVQDGNEFTVTPESDCTIRINFAAKQIATITLMEAGTPVAGPNDKYSGDSYTLPSSVTNVCEDKTFVGWSTVELPTEGGKPTENYYAKGAEVTLAANNTFYAVYADAAGGADPVAYTAGDEGSFVLAALNDGKWYALPTNPTVSSGKITGVEISVSQTGGGVNYVTTENATGYTWTIANATNGQTISDGTKYIYHSNGGNSGTELAYGNSTTLTWSIASEKNGLTFQGMNNGTVNGRGMLVSGTTFGGYALSNEDATGYYRISVLPISGASYSNYTTCGSKYSVTFKNQESVISTDEYTAGTVIYAPATAENTCGDGFFFVGWLAQPLYVGATPNPKPTGLIQPNGEITVPAEDVVYYAVFAQKRIN